MKYLSNFYYFVECLKLLLVCLMAIHCVLSMPSPVENDAQEQIPDDLATAEHHSHNYGGKYLFIWFVFRK